MAEVNFTPELTEAAMKLRQQINLKIAERYMEVVTRFGPEMADKWMRGHELRNLVKMAHNTGRMVEMVGAA